MDHELAAEIEKFGVPVSALETAVEKAHNHDYLMFALAMLTFAGDAPEVNAVRWALEKKQEEDFLHAWALANQPSMFLDVKIPEGMTLAQAKSLLDLWNRNHDGSPTFAHFLRHRVTGVGREYIAVNPWCNMFIGIEKDGYAHS